MQVRVRCFVCFAWPVQCSREQRRQAVERVHADPHRGRLGKGPGHEGAFFLRGFLWCFCSVKGSSCGRAQRHRPRQVGRLPTPRQGLDAEEEKGSSSETVCISPWLGSQRA